MISLEGVNKYFNRHKKNEIHVINNATISFPKNGLVAILGPSGCGKTTMLNAIGGLDKVGSGHIYIDGKRITKRSSSKVDEIRNLNIGYIFQDYKLVDNMTVFENVALSLKIIGVKDDEEINKHVMYALEKVNMARYKNRPASMLSGGEKQRVGIARALVKNPKIIIADEPTGNLDSKNSLEVMNIIKSISNKYLVILVTHEEELARFYATKIIELKDGVIERCYDNKNDGTLNYKIENRIYLKDYQNITNLKQDNLNIKVYRANNEKLDINLVFKNGNIYIESKNDEKIEVVENNSNIELINDHYKEIKETKLEVNYDIESITNKKIKHKYSSIFRLASFITYGFKKVFAYPFLKKILLGGFFLSGMFIFYSVSSIFATINIEDKDFITYNKEYLTANIKNINVDNYLSYEKNENINYILPSDSVVYFKVPFTKFLQTQYYSGTFGGSLSSIKMINENDLKYGRMPENEYEIVVDEMVLNNFIESYATNMVGLFKVEDYLNEVVNLKNMKDIKIVGITSLEEPNIYASESMFINLISNSNERGYGYAEYYDGFDYTENVNNFIDYNLVVGERVKLVKGKLPESDYEVIINSDYEGMFPLNKVIEQKINDKKLKVVGYYENITADYTDAYLVNNNTIKYNLINNASNISVYSNNKSEALDYLLNEKINIKDSYDYAKSEYLKGEKDSIISNLIVSLIILGISLIEILLMIRSSFLSRIKEVGIYRAIGIKKSDIYKMFSGEIIAISFLASFTGISFMTYILYCLKSIPFIGDMWMVNIFTFGLSIIVVFIFNLIVGLLPVFNTIRKTPAAILARFDVD